MSVVYLVIPCYNEEKVLPETVKRLTAKLGAMISSGLAAPESRMLFVDDGSRDGTWALICRCSGENRLVSGIKLAHNRGHQNALLAGLMTARRRADCAISLDADLQDDIEVLDQFVRKFQEGCDVVYGVRKKRETDTFFKRVTALAFYRFLAALGVDVVYNHADYRLMSRRALDALSEYREVNLFLRGLVPLIGYRSDFVYYDRHERFAGESKYPLKKMIAFAVDGITSFSVKPLKLIFNLGAAVSLAGATGLIWAAIAHFTQGWSGWIAAFWSSGSCSELCCSASASPGLISERFMGKSRRARALKSKNPGALRLTRGNFKTESARISGSGSRRNGNAR